MEGFVVGDDDGLLEHVAWSTTPLITTSPYPAVIEI
jgi:hypothetical protein